MRGNSHAPHNRGRTSWKDASLIATFRWLTILVLIPALLGATPVAASGGLLGLGSGNGLIGTTVNNVLGLTTALLAKLDPYLFSELQQSPSSSYRVIIQRHNGDTSADSLVKKNGGTKIEDLPDGSFVAIINGLSIKTLLQATSIQYVTVDAPMLSTTEPDLTDISQLQTMYPETVQATDAWGEGDTGAGVGVAVIDTGIAQVKDFSGRIVAQQSFIDTSSTSDGYGHGTHIAGVIAGDSWDSSQGVQGKYVGVAPDANLINLRVADDTGQVYESDVVLAFEWAIAHRVQYNIRVINLSMTSTVPESYHTSFLAAAAEHAWFNGILVVVAAGNQGPNQMYYAPADDPFVVTVGATDANGTVDASDDWIAPWSNSGTNPDGVTKPDVVAPGRLIDSTLAKGSEFQQEYPSRIVDQNYIWMSGTSMSTAVVSGVAALIFQAHPNWTNDQVKWVLEQTATKLNVDPTTQGAGEVNADAAVNYAGTPQYANQGLTISNDLVGPNGSLVYDVTTLVGSVLSTAKDLLGSLLGSNSSSSSWSGSAWSGSAWSGSAWSGSAWSGSAWSGSGDIQ
ncbi:MAG TPA: S8 family peptidase [Nitrolancea sp.]|jgi:serine protease AprX|nr:S8 family peptidase [Nitrolancea sp.]